MKPFKSKQYKSSNTNTNLILTPPVHAGEYLRQTGTYADMVEQTDLNKLRGELRKFSNLNETFSIVLKLTSLFASKHPRIVCEDPQNQKKLNACFERSGWQTFLQEFTKEYLLCGEATSWTTWNNDLKCFEPEQIIPPSEIIVKTEDETSKPIIVAHKPTARTSTNKILFTQKIDDDSYAPSQPTFNGAEIPQDELIRAVHKNQPWDLVGYPFFAPALTALVQKESLDSALYEQLNELATPLIICTVGLKANELGPNQPAWVPTDADLEKIDQSIQMLMMGTSRIGTFKIGVNFHNAFEGSEIADLTPHYKRCEEAILRTVGAGRGLIDGSAGGPYASDAVNRDVYSAFVESLRGEIIRAFQKRVNEAIIKLGLKAFRVDADGNRRLTYPTRDGGLTFDPEMGISPIPADEIAVLSFDQEVMKDTNAELNVLQTLLHNDVPISKQTLANATNLGINIRSELRQIHKEQQMIEETDTENNVQLLNNPGKVKNIDYNETEKLRQKLTNPDERDIKGL